jgi:NOT2 / NOT3 / NOT5 family
LSYLTRRIGNSDPIWQPLIGSSFHYCQVPGSYLQNAPRLLPGAFSKMALGTVFYAFYSMPGDEAQLYAADELRVRDWWFHKRAFFSCACSALCACLLLTSSETLDSNVPTQCVFSV